MDPRHISIVFLVILSCLMPSIDAKSEESQVRLVIGNDSPSPLRCVAVLAHFVTRQFPVIAPDSELIVVVVRNSDTGELAIRPADSLLMIENILCGSDSDWSRTVNDVSLLALRRGAEADYRLSCTGSCEQKLHCRF